MQGQPAAQNNRRTNWGGIIVTALFVIALGLTAWWAWNKFGKTHDNPQPPNQAIVTTQTPKVNVPITFDCETKTVKVPKSKHGTIVIQEGWTEVEVPR